jgi:hypothetical protein
MALNPALGCSMQFSCWEAGQTKATLVLTKEAVRGYRRKARRPRPISLAAPEQREPVLSSDKRLALPEDNAQSWS